jgi:c-di-GMP-binding flagellar brake protein YcgR
LLYLVSTVNYQSKCVINMSDERSVNISLHIPADEYLRVYQGEAKKVSAIDSQGRRISFPVNILQSFVTRDGINGAFTILFDENYRFKEIIKRA